MEEVGVEGYEWNARDVRFNSGDFNRLGMPNPKLSSALATRQEKSNPLMIFTSEGDDK